MPVDPETVEDLPPVPPIDKVYDIHARVGDIFADRWDERLALKDESPTDLGDDSAAFQVSATQLIRHAPDADGLCPMCPPSAGVPCHDALQAWADVVRIARSVDVDVTA